MEIKIILVIVIMVLSAIDLILTAYYIHTYKSWQPNKPYKLMELNPLLVFLWNKMGFVIGMIVGSVVILSLNFIVSKGSHWIIVIILLICLIFALINHVHNISLLQQLMEKYPTGVLPKEIFGEVVGNNYN